jgi:hypothetical protein
MSQEGLLMDKKSLHFVTRKKDNCDGGGCGSRRSEAAETLLGARMILSDKTCPIFAHGSIGIAQYNHNRLELKLFSIEQQNLLRDSVSIDTPETKQKRRFQQNNVWGSAHSRLSDESQTQIGKDQTE